MAASEKDRYEGMLQLLIQAELAARNKQWPTCGTACRRAMEWAFKFAEEDESEDNLNTV